jgi:hypothetical protein
MVGVALKRNLMKQIMIMGGEVNCWCNVVLNGNF